jgi:FAD/FMN-containing dehydrogenase
MTARSITDEVLVAFADEIGSTDPVAVVGARTRWSTGGPSADGTRLVTAPHGIVAHSASEMTVQVRAGTTVAELDAALAEQGQRCALPDRGGTVGGAVAVGENGLDVLSRGRVRDAVLQIRYVSAEGRLVTGGGPVVKNVTGFNLTKLMTGSLGTLGLFGELILRTNPVPAAERWLASEGIDPVAVFDALYRPAAVLWDGTTTWVHLEGYTPDIDAESAGLAGLGDFVEVEGPPVLPPHRWSLTPAEVVSATGRDTGAFVATVGVGLVFAEKPSPTPTPPVSSVAVRMKQDFDPTGRLNPGRRPGI